MVRGRIGKSIKWGRVGGENKSWHNEDESKAYDEHKSFFIKGPSFKEQKMVRFGHPMKVGWFKITPAKPYIYVGWFG